MNIYTGLLFLDGHVADPRLTSELADPAGQSGRLAVDEAPSLPRRGERRTAPRGAVRRGAERLLQNLVFLGGRPMTAGHNYDVDEPFPPPHGGLAGPRRGAKRAQARRNARPAQVSPPLPSCARC